MDEELTQYIDTIKPKVEAIEQLAGVIMPSDPVPLINYITQVRGFCVYLNEIRCHVKRLYRQAENTYKPAKTRDTTELDRDILLKSLVSEYEYWLERIDGLVRIIEGHSSMAQSIIAFEKMAMGHLNVGG